MDDVTNFESFVAAHTPLAGRTYADFTDIEKAIYSASCFNLCGGPEAAVALMRAIDHVTRQRIPGALVECGVYWGANIEVMIRALQHLGCTDRDIYLYDTFAGMPCPTREDDEGRPGDIKAFWEKNRTAEDGSDGSTWMRAGIDVVRQRLEPLGYPDARLHYVKGLVENTIPRTRPGQIAILRLDTDFYSSTRHELHHLYPRLSRGGILIIDDYGALPGSRRATDEYIEENGLALFLNRVDAHVRLAVKP